MLFTSLSYLFFFPVVFCLYWLSPKDWRRALLLFASYLFYMSWIPTYGVLLFVMTAINYFFGLAIDRYRARAKTVMAIGVTANLCALIYFKYTNFFLNSLKSTISACEPWLRLPVTAADVPLTTVILPLGISFFVFEFIHYIVDIFRGHKPIKSPLDFALFAAFFPSQIAGPIKRFQDFEHQLSDLKPLNPTLVHNGICLILQGLFKKVALSDNLSSIVTSGYAHVHSLGTLDAWLVAVGFSIQVYLDFSGYTDMGRGSAMLLGFKLPDNFDLPFFAGSLVTFWRKWHISLSTWLKDYLYIPLGGGKVSRMRRHFNLFITMTLGGLWHGAAFHYVVWGAMHGVTLGFIQEYHAFADRHEFLKKLHAHDLVKLLCIGVTFTVFTIYLAMFRSLSIADAMIVYNRMFVFHAPAANSLATTFANSTAPVALFAYFMYFVLSNGDKLPYIQDLRAYLQSRAALARVCGWPTRIAIYAGSFLAALGFSPNSASPFIYFQF